LPKVSSKSAVWFLLLAPLTLTLAIPPLAHAATPAPGAAPTDSTKSFKAYQKHLQKQAKKTQKAQEKAQKRQKKLHPTGH
jgi:hypothetical protein